jgi:amino-acid N-acetyltransferase
MATSLLCEPPESRISHLLSQSTRKKPSIRTRKAGLPDAKAIHQLIDSFTYDGTLLRRSYPEICRNIGTFTVVETEAKQFIGCAALHIYGPHLAEIRSIVVHPGAAGNGAGSLLVQSLLHQAEQAGIKCVCLFTRIPAFFEHFHFCIAERQLLQDKIWKDCQSCSRRNACDETAMAIGELPSLHHMPSIESIHHTPQGGLVQLQL